MADGTTSRTRHRIVTIRMVVVSAIVGVVLAVASVPVAAVVPLPLQLVRSGILDIEEPVSLDDARSIGRQWLSVHVGYHTGAHFTMLNATDDPRPPYARPAGRTAYTLWYVRAGWPCFAAEGRNLNSSTHEFLVRMTLFGERHSIPLRPIWFGLLANTLFYAVIILGVLVGLHSWRTRRRRARGRCVACGYELGEGVGVCPECGLAARPLAKGG